MESRLTPTTNRRSLPREPAEVRRLLASIVESSEDAIYGKDLNGIVTSWNASAQRVFGYTADEILGHSVAMLIPPEVEDDFLSVLNRLRLGEGVQHYETVRLAKAGRRVPVSLTISPIRDDDGRIIGASTIARDITARRIEESRWRFLAQMGDALSEVLDVESVLKELARILVPETADYCITYLVEEGRIRRVGTAHADPARARFLERLAELAPPELADATGPGAVIRTGEDVLIGEIDEKRLAAVGQDPEYRKVLRELAPLSSIIVALGARGRTVGAITLATTAHSGRRLTEADRTFAREIADRAALALDNVRLYEGAQAEIERREAAEEALRHRYEALRVLYQITDAVGRAGDVRAVYERVLDGLEDALGARRASILLFDGDGVLRFQAWRGLSPEYRAAVEGHSPWTRDTPSPAPIVVADVAADSELDPWLREAILREGIRALAFFPIVFRNRLLGKFMLYFDAPVSLGPEERELALTIGGTLGFAIAKMRDEQSVREAKDAAERASEAKSQFLGIMSHELRTPLNAVLGYGDLLLLETRGPLTAGQREQVERIKASAQHQLGLVEELLTYTRLEAGREEARVVETDARRILCDVVELVRPQAEAKGLALHADLPDTPIPLLTDPAKLRQIALNLAGNAAKYTDRGEVRVRAWCRNRHFQMEVSDTGIGIPDEKLDYIFEPFAQVDQSRTRVAGGTGLGLAIAKQFTTLLGGTIAVESRVGGGSTFTVSLPNSCQP